MAVTDFAQVADPWLRILQDDPERSDPITSNRRPFHLAAANLMVRFSILFVIVTL